MKRITALFLVFIMAILCLSCGRPATDAPRPPSDGIQNAVPLKKTEPVYIITDYYDEGGEFSALGLALDEENSEKVLTVKSGDTLVVGEREYVVTAPTLTLSFYTQPTLDEVIAWWTEYCQSRIERGELQ